ncbi:MAG: multicopper oxidase domain-containing protein, partial [Acidimicrobiales bacterium]
WNSEELNFEYAMTQYNLYPNNYQPDIIPTVLFKIFQTNTTWYNYAMTSNDTLKIQIYDQPISYTGKNVDPISSATIVFPPTNPNPPLESTKPYNIKEWANLVNKMFKHTNVIIDGKKVRLNKLLTFTWTFFPFRFNYLSKKTKYIKSVVMITVNSSKYYISLSGSWNLLQFFGKSMTAMPSPPPKECMNMFPKNKDFYVTNTFVNYATDDPNNPIMICMDSPAIMIIKPKQSFLGTYDAGFENDGLMNFSVKSESTEYWIYYNLDTGDSHPFHYHLTSGFVSPQDPINSSLLVDDSSLYDSHLYSLDVQGIPSQQRLAWYLKFPTYTSNDVGLYKQKPLLRDLGYMYHCHYMVHHDMDMMGQYYVFANKEDYFS